MRRVRVIPVLLLSNDGMVKTTSFRDRRYLGDPINAVKIFNDREADELVILDIDATERGSIDFSLVEDIASEAFMPVAYGGGIDSVDTCGRLLSLGIEKVVVNTAAVEHPDVLQAMAQRFGSQAIMVSIDVKYSLLGRPHAAVRGGRRSTGMSPWDLAQRSETLGAGEILLTNVSREGQFSGLDISLTADVSSRVGIPVIAHGGAGCIADFVPAVVKGGASAVAAGSMFVFAGKGEGVLINYPAQSELKSHFWGKL